MDNFSVPTYFLVPIVLSFFALVGLLISSRHIYKDGKWRAFWISLTVFFVVYLLLLLSVIYLEHHYDLELEKFNLNSDGNSSQSEITPEHQLAIRNVTNDLARSMAPYTGVFIAGFISCTVFVVGKIIEFIRRRKKQN